MMQLAMPACHMHNTLLCMLAQRPHACGGVCTQLSVRTGEVVANIALFISLFPQARMLAFGSWRGELRRCKRGEGGC